MTHRRRTDDADQTVLELAEAWADSWLASAGTEPPEDLPHERALFRAVRARREPCVPEDFAVEKYNEAYSRKSAERRVLEACWEAETRTAHMGKPVQLLSQGSSQRIAEAVIAWREAIETRVHLSAQPAAPKDHHDALKIIEQLRRDKSALRRALQASAQVTREALEQLATVELNDDSNPLEQAIAGARAALNGQPAAPSELDPTANPRPRDLPEERALFFAIRARRAGKAVTGG